MAAAQAAAPLRELFLGHSTAWPVQHLYRQGAPVRRVLFLCTHNSSRSQMTEGLLRHQYGRHYDVQSAGTAPRGVNPYAVRAMAEPGIDLSAHTSDHVAACIGESFDLVVTVCDDAKEACPFLPGAQRTIHERFEDPTDVTGSDQERLAAFRQTRDEIAAWIGRTSDPQGGTEAL